MPSETLTPWLRPDVCARAIAARDPRFDGLFFVGITTTRVYCRPICPSRAATPAHRRFFESAAAAERAGFRPCLRCRPELAPGRGGGRSRCDAVTRLAGLAAQRIAAGALNGHGVADLARDLEVSERHLRRALERELGVSPVELAQTHRLLLAKRLLADTALPVTRVAYASGFQSLRRFNAVFREQYRMSPSALRPPRRAAARPLAPARDLVRLTLAYRPPLAWDALLAQFARAALPGVEVVHEGAGGGRYARTVSLNGHRGVVCAVNDAAKAHLNVDVSTALLPVLMPLLARLRQLFDLDAQPLVIDAHLEQSGLGAVVRRQPGLRIPGAFEGFDVVLQTLLGDQGGRVVAALGETVETGMPGLTHVAPSASRVVAAGTRGLMELGVSGPRAAVLGAVARALLDGSVRLGTGSDATAARAALCAIAGVDDRAATTIVMRVLTWPDAFPAGDPLVLQAERWRPWRAYAALAMRQAKEGERTPSRTEIARAWRW